MNQMITILAIKPSFFVLHHSVRKRSRYYHSTFMEAEKKFTMNLKQETVRI